MVIGRARANDRGEWVVVPDSPIAKGDHQLTLEARDGNGQVVVSEQAVIIKVPDSDVDQPLIVLAEPMKPSRVLQTPEVASKTGDVIVAQQNQQASAPAQQPAAQEAPAPTTEQATQEAAAKAAQEAEMAAQQAAAKAAQEAEMAAQQAAAKAAQEAEMAAQQAAAKAAQEAAAKAVQEAAVKAAQEAAARAAQESAVKAAQEAAAKAAQEAEMAAQQAADKAAQLAARSPLGLGSVDYNDSGDIMLSGQASPGASVRLYVDNGFIADTSADASGNWTFVGREQIGVGDHQLRADEVDAQGKVVARVEVPFARAGQEDVAALQKSREQVSTEKADKMTEPATGQQASQEPAKTGQPAKTEEPVQQQIATGQEIATTAERPAQQAGEQPAPQNSAGW